MREHLLENRPLNKSACINRGMYSHFLAFLQTGRKELGLARRLTSGESYTSSGVSVVDRIPVDYVYYLIDGKLLSLHLQSIGRTNFDALSAIVTRIPQEASLC